jgi:hypothetical protein
MRAHSWSAIFILLGGSLSVGAMIGFVMLFGITRRPFRGAKERLTPICMTPLLTAADFWPQNLNSPGSAIDCKSYCADGYNPTVQPLIENTPTALAYIKAVFGIPLQKQERQYSRQGYRRPYNSHE